STDIGSPGRLSTVVANAAPGGGTSAAVNLTVTSAVPVMSSISPNSVQAGSAAITLTVNGSNFISGSVVQVNGSSRTTTFVSSTQLKAAIPASDLAVGALLSITVFTSGGGTSSAVTLTVTNPVPSISNISPSTTLVLGNSFTLTVNGSGFTKG